MGIDVIIKIALYKIKREREREREREIERKCLISVRTTVCGNVCSAESQWEPYVAFFFLSIFSFPTFDPFVVFYVIARHHN